MYKDGIKSFTIGPLGLLVLTLAMFFDVLFLPGDAVLSNAKTDLAAQFVHWRGFGFGEMSRGNLPLWNPHIYSGAPFLAGFQSALLYPLNVLYLVLPLAKALVDARVNLGILLVKKGKVEEARKEYLTALRIAPNLAEAHFSLGNLYLREGKLEDARRHLAEAVQANPDPAGARTNLGVTLGRQGNIPEAIGQPEKAVALKPDSVEARDNLARAYWVTGRSSDALRELATLKKLNPAMAKRLQAWMDSTGPKPAARRAS